MSAPENVGVILPYRNRADTLVEAAESVLNQTYSNLTLFLVNDGSNDRSRDLARGLKDDRIVHIDIEESLGVSGARNVGLDHASQVLISFMDSDDSWLPEKLEAQLAHLEHARESHASVAVIGCGWRYHGITAPSRSFSSGPFNRADVLQERVSGIGTPMLLVDRTTAAPNARFDERLLALEDRDYVMSCLANGSLVCVSTEILALVRRGRPDHAATSRRAAVSYELLLEKYSAELASLDGLRAWYSFRASREYLLHGDVRSASRHLLHALGGQGLTRAIHLLMAGIARKRGVALAQRLLPLQGPPSRNSFRLE